MAEIMDKRFLRLVFCLLAFSVLIFPLAGAEQAHILNSGDWKDTVSAVTFFPGEKFLVRNPGEAERAVTEYNSSAVVVNSRENTGFTGLASRIGGEKTGYSYEDVYQNSSDLEKLYIVNPGLASEALTALPEALEKDKALTFYSSESLENLDSTVKTVFLGSYIDKPWKNRENSKVISSGSYQELNREFVRKRYSGGAVLLTDPETPGFQSLLSGDQILLRGGVEKDAELLEQLGVETIKVIGPENTDYARQLNSLTSQDLRIAAKVGRALADQDNAELYGIKSLEPDVRKGKLSIESAVYDQSEGLMRINLANPGVEITAVMERIVLSEGGSQTVQSSGHGFYLGPGGDVSLMVNLQKGLVPTKARFEGVLNGEAWSNSTEVEIADIEDTPIGIERSGDTVTSRSAESVYSYEGGDVKRLESLGSGRFRLPETSGDNVRLAVSSNDSIYLKELGSSGTDRYLVLSVIIASLITAFFLLVGYREIISDR
jgi:hypothetical protein